MIANGGKKITGPLLVVHGMSDHRLSPDTTTATVKSTVQAFPDSQLEYVLLPMVTHAPAIQASQRLWMEWIADRLNQRLVPHNVKLTILPRARPATSYHDKQNWYIASATRYFHPSSF